tara:strand:+ start:273 stop:947 length:675 start_codon:yes stop_codon:yes gene_type:complete
MIGWLQGKIVHKWQISSKEGAIINVGGVGYEIQLLPKQIDKVECSNKIELWVHQIDREDGTNLYGFLEVNQRDLFRDIIGVNGIGPQIGMALLEDFEVNEFVKKIEEKDSIVLTKSQGIGKRIAERLVVELKNKLQRFIDPKELRYDNKEYAEPNALSKYIDEIYLILNSLGYLDNEIKDSIQIITKNEKENTYLLNSLSGEKKAELMDKHLKEILRKLSAKST